jgi:hypothetical protein
MHPAREQNTAGFFACSLQLSARTSRHGKSSASSRSLLLATSCMHCVMCAALQGPFLFRTLDLLEQLQHILPRSPHYHLQLLP